MKEQIIAGIAAIALSGCSAPEYSRDAEAVSASAKIMQKKHDAFNYDDRPDARTELLNTDDYYNEQAKEPSEKTYKTTIRGVTVELYNELGKITPQQGYTEITGIKKIIYDRKGRYADCMFDKEKGKIMIYHNGDISVSGARLRLKLSEKDNKKLEDKISLFGR